MDDLEDQFLPLPLPKYANWPSGLRRAVGYQDDVIPVLSERKNGSYLVTYPGSEHLLLVRRGGALHDAISEQLVRDYTPSCRGVITQSYVGLLILDQARETYLVPDAQSIPICEVPAGHSPIRPALMVYFYSMNLDQALIEALYAGLLAPQSVGKQVSRENNDISESWRLIQVRLAADVVQDSWRSAHRWLERSQLPCQFEGDHPIDRLLQPIVYTFGR